MGKNGTIGKCPEMSIGHETHKMNTAGIDIQATHTRLKKEVFEGPDKGGISKAGGPLIYSNLDIHITDVF